MKVATPVVSQEHTTPKFNPFELQNNTWSRTDISIGAKSLMNRLRNSAGKKGKIQYSVKKLAVSINVSERQARYYIKELIGSGLLKREFVRGHSNWWYIVDVYGLYQTPATDCSTVKDPIRIKENVSYVTSLESREPDNQNLPETRKDFQKTPFNLPLVNQIVMETGDKKSTKYWIMVVNKLPESEILQYLSHLKIAMNEGIVRNPGAYLNSIVLSNHPELKKSSSTNPPQPQQQKKCIKPKEPEIVPASPEVAKMAITGIIAILKQPRKVG
jgi:hypothetical protein